jgi:hypothetical protein
MIFDPFDRSILSQCERFSNCDLIQVMTKISEREFKRILEGIIADADSIFVHNPIGSREETLLWMLMSCLIMYLDLSEVETPCFTGRPDAATYREAIGFIVSARKANDFDIEADLDRLVNA